mgnify:CR=1 FL=1
MESNKHIQKSKCNCDNVKATSDKKQVKDNTKGEIVKYQDECKQRKVALMVSLMFKEVEIGRASCRERV